MFACALLFPSVSLATFGIDPGKVFIDNLYPGAEADVPITIYNQNEHATNFQIRARSPDYTEQGYEPFPYLEWVSIQPEQVTIDANETADVLVVIIMPEDAQYSGKKAELWISFTEEEKPGEMIQVEIASRLLISTRLEEEAEPVKPEPSEPEASTQPAKETEPEKPELEKPEAVTVQPTEEDGGEIGITAEGGESEGGTSRFPWIIVGPVVGLIAIVGIVLFLRRARQ
jgi:hypothetical protein